MYDNNGGLQFTDQEMTDQMLDGREHTAAIDRDRVRALELMLIIVLGGYCTLRYGATVYCCYCGWN